VTQKIFKYTKDKDSGERVEDRTRERNINNLLLLHLIDETNKKGKLENNFKVQKLVFSIQKKLVQRKLKAFSYNFFRWKQGPFSKNLNEDLKLLNRNKLISWGGKKIVLTKQGEHILKECKELFENNTFFSDIFNSVVNEFANLSPEEIKERIYKQNLFVPIIRKSMLIEKIPSGRLMLFRPTNNKMKKIFEISEGWEATLELLLDEEASVSLERAYEDAREGRHGKPTRVHTP
jgi:uncharacterized phage-associated protein